MPQKITPLMFSTTITHAELSGVIKSFLFTPGYTPAGEDIRWGIPFAVWGEPGTAKSSITRELGARFFDQSLTMSLAQHDAEEIGGYGVPNKTRTAMTKLPSPVFGDANAAARACIGLDEFGSVEEHKQAAALTLLTERLAGDTKVAGSVRLFAIGNPPECATNANALGEAVSNRFLHVPWIAPGAADFRAHLRSAASLQREIVREDAEAIEAAVLSQWPEAYGTASAIIGGYLAKFESDLHAMPYESGSPDDNRWPSVRTWTNLVHALAGAICHKLSAKQIEFVIYCALPEGLAARVSAYWQDQDLPAPRDVLTDPESYEISQRFDKTHAVLGMTVAYLAGYRGEDRLELARAWWAFADRVIESPYGGADFVREYARDMCKGESKGGLALGPSKISEAEDVARKLYDVLFAEKAAKAKS